MVEARTYLRVFVVLTVVAATLAVGPSAGAQTVPAVHGEWSDVLEWPFIPIHASIDQEGNVLTYGGRGGGGYLDEFFFDVWDPSNPDQSSAHSTSTHTLGSNLFCSFALSDPSGQGGSILMGGEESAARGLPDFVARYRNGEFTDFPSMNYPRWYGTGTTLPDGRILIQGGTEIPDSDERAVDTAEVYSEEDGWVALTGTTESGLWNPEGWWYPKSFVTPAGDIWNLAGQDMYYLNADGVGGVEMIGTYNELANTGGTASAVNYAPGKILQIGGNKATIFDLNYDPPRIIEAAPMHENRLFANAMVLPDGRVLVTGGSGQFNANADVAYAAEIWDPATNTWTLLAESQVPRLYHSTALLMPDGRIFTGGGGAPGPQNHLNAEIYSPPYLFGANGAPASQPSLSVDDEDLGYGETFTASTDTAIDRVTMLRVGHNTHAMSTQNFIELHFAQTQGQLTIATPEYATLATPGEYMIFALDAQGVPSVAEIVNISGDSPAPPAAIPNTASPELIEPWQAPPPKEPFGITVPNQPAVVPRREEVTCGGFVATIVGTSGADVLRGTSGRDVIAALQGDDVVHGLGGEDILCGGMGNDVLYGGAGFDIIYGAQGHDQLYATSTGTRDDSRGARMFGGQGNDELFGSNRWDRMQGGPGTDELHGYAGRDWIRGGPHSDHVDGGSGVDDLHSGAGSDVVIASVGDKVRAGLGTDRCINSQLAESAWSCEER